jgi:hypothetical protein
LLDRLGPKSRQAAVRQSGNQAQSSANADISHIS